MKNQTLTITTNFEWDFYEIFDGIGEKQQKIYRFLDRFCKQYPNVFPSQTTIAKQCKCSRKHVNRTLALFKKFGWLSLKSRGVRRSKTITFSKSNISLDLHNRQYFRRLEVTTRGTYIYSKDLKSTSRRTGGASPPLQIPFYLQKLNISLDSKLKLSMVSEHVYQETYHALKKRAKNGFSPQNDEKYFVGAAIKMAQNKGEKLPWKRYYATR